MMWLLQALNLRDRDDVFTIYIGDDTTDEDAFEVTIPPLPLPFTPHVQTPVLSPFVLTLASPRFLYACRCSRSTSCRAWASW